MESQHWTSPNALAAVYTAVYTDIFIFAVQSLQKKGFFQACTRLQQGTCALYCGPILKYIYM